MAYTYSYVYCAKAINTRVIFFPKRNQLWAFFAGPED